MGGQLTSSFVFTLEKHDQKEWGFHGSIVLISCDIGALFGSLLGCALRSTLSDEQLETFGWRIPFWLGILLCIPAYHLKYYVKETLASSASSVENKVNPIEEAFKSPENRRSVIAVALVTTLGTGSFYLTFIWMPIFMEDLIDPPQKQAFLITTLVILLSFILFKPIPGILSDKYGRKNVMTPGAIGIAIFGPLTIYVASTRNTIATFFVHTFLGMSIAFYAAPSPAWLLESFPDHRTRLTCVSLGYNLATSTIGGFSPLIATLMYDNVGLLSPGILFVTYAIVSMFGLHCVASKMNRNISL